MAQSVTVAINLGPAKAGLSDLRAQLIDTTGAAVGTAVSTGFTDLGTGTYQWFYASVPGTFQRGTVKFYSNAASTVTLATGSIGPGDLLAVSGSGGADFGSILGTGFTETTAGNIAAAFKHFLDVASPAFTAASVNQTGDGYAVVSNATYGNAQLARTSATATITNQSTILNAVNGITTNTARSAPRVPDFMARPSSGSVAYTGDLYLYTLQGALEDADTNTVTVHARNAAGTNLDTNLSSTTMTRVSAGFYRFTYTVHSTDTAQAVYFDFSWTINAAAMKDGAATEVQDAENYAFLTAIKAQTDKFLFDGSSNVAANMIAAGGNALGGGGTGIANMDADYRSNDGLNVSPASIGAIQSGLATESNATSNKNTIVTAVGNATTAATSAATSAGTAATQATSAASGIANVSNANGTIKLPATANQTLSDLGNMTVNAGTANAALSAGALALAPSTGLTTDQSNKLNVIYANTGSIIAGKVTVRSPVVSAGNISIIQGNDYNTDTNQPLLWTDTGGNWPDLTGATIAFALLPNIEVRCGAGTPVTGSVIVPSGSGKQVQVQLTASYTAALAPGAAVYNFAVIATLSSGSVCTLVAGTVDVVGSP